MVSEQRRHRSDELHLRELLPRTAPRTLRPSKVSALWRDEEPLAGKSGTDIFGSRVRRVLDPSGRAPDQAVFAPVTGMGMQCH